MKCIYLTALLLFIQLIQIRGQEKGAARLNEDPLQQLKYQDKIVYKTEDGKALELILFLPKEKKFSKISFDSYFGVAKVRNKLDFMTQQCKPAKGQASPNWRKEIFYEYYWTNAFPQTPTQFAIRTDQYKFIRTQGIWDINQLYDIVKDPYELNNLIRKPESQGIAKDLNSKLWNWLDETGGMSIPLKKIGDKKFDHAYADTW